MGLSARTPKTRPSLSGITIPTCVGLAESPWHMTTGKSYTASCYMANTFLVLMCWYQGQQQVYMLPRTSHSIKNLIRDLMSANCGRARIGGPRELKRTALTRDIFHPAKGDLLGEVHRRTRPYGHAFYCMWYSGRNEDENEPILDFLGRLLLTMRKNSSHNRLVFQRTQ